MGEGALKFEADYTVLLLVKAFFSVAMFLLFCYLVETQIFQVKSVQQVLGTQFRHFRWVTRVTGTESWFMERMQARRGMRRSRSWCRGMMYCRRGIGRASESPDCNFAPSRGEHILTIWLCYRRLPGPSDSSTMSLTRKSILLSSRMTVSTNQFASTYRVWLGSLR